MRYTANDCIAFDRKSMRYTAGNGFFHVELSPLTKAQVAPYRGRELVDAKQRGLDPDKIYYVYRPAEELSSEETVRSVIGIPITLEHEYIDPEVKDDSMRQLSLGYTYDPEWTAGETADGEHYDLIMRNIRANHVALVEEGRAGPDVMVFDDNTAVKPKKGSIAMDENVTNVLASIAESLQSSASALQGLLGGNQQPSSEMAVPATDEDTDDISAAPEEEAAADEGDEDAGTVADEGDESLEEEAAADDDDEVATDSDDEDAACDSDDEGACDDDDAVTEGEFDAATQEVLANAGLSEASPEVQRIFLTGLEVTKQLSAADSKRGLKAKRTAAKTTKRRLTEDSMNQLMDERIRAFKAGFEASVKRRVNAARRVRKTLGDVNPLAYDSASAIYRAAISRLGKRVGAKTSLPVLRDTYDALCITKSARRKVAADSGANLITGTAALLNDLVGSKVIY